MAATGGAVGDDVAKAAAAWRHFVALLEVLPPDQAQPLWREVYEQAARAIGGLSGTSG